MAGSLLRAGLPVDIWDRSPERAAPLAERGATAHPELARAVEHADVTITMLADAAVVAAVATEQGMLDAMGPGAIWAQMGTIGVHGTEQLAELTARRRPEVLFVDAPVSGTRQPAEAGQLLILASAPEAARPALGPVFDAIGSRTLWLGPAGAGSRLKLVLNTWLAFLMEGIAESVALADALGVDHQALHDALTGSPLAAPAALVKLAKIDSGDESADFSLRWATKDVDLAVTESGGVLPVADAIRRRWHDLVEQGLGDADVSAARHGLGQVAPASRGTPS